MLGDLPRMCCVVEAQQELSDTGHSLNHGLSRFYQLFDFNSPEDGSTHLGWLGSNIMTSNILEVPAHHSSTYCHKDKVLDQLFNFKLI